MENKKVLVILIVIIGAVAVGAGYYLTQGGGPEGGEKTKLKVAVVMDSFKRANGWNESMYHGILDAREKYGDRIKVSLSEDVSIPQYSSVMERYAEDGYDLIFCHSSVAGDQAHAVAKEYPGVWISWTDGYGELENNMVAIKPLAHEASYLAGMLAGGMTDSDIIGVVGAMKVPSTYRSYYAFKKGVERVNPEAEILTTWTGSFTDISGSREAARSHLTKGADILVGNGDSINEGVRTVAKNKGVYYIGAVTDESEYAPDVTLASVLWGFENSVPDLIEKVLNNNVEPGSFINIDMDDGATLKWNEQLKDNVPDSLMQDIQKVKEDILSGNFEVPRKAQPPEE